jgi:hypothetical protein
MRDFQSGRSNPEGIARTTGNAQLHTRVSAPLRYKVRHTVCLDFLRQRFEYTNWLTAKVAISPRLYDRELLRRLAFLSGACADDATNAL